MNRIKSLTIVFLVILVLLILVIVRNSDQNLFKKEVKDTIEAAQNNSNTISFAQLKKLNTNWLVVNLGSDNIPDSLQIKNSISIPFENLLNQTNRNILKEVKGEIILYSSDVATTAKAWVILNQLDYKNIFILTSGENPEVIKYKFQPDTTVRLEQDSM